MNFPTEINEKIMSYTEFDIFDKTKEQMEQELSKKVNDIRKNKKEEYIKFIVEQINVNLADMYKNPMNYLISPETEICIFQIYVQEFVIEYVEEVLNLFRPKFNSITHERYEPAHKRGHPVSRYIFS